MNMSFQSRLLSLIVVEINLWLYSGYVTAASTSAFPRGWSPDLNEGVEIKADAYSNRSEGSLELCLKAWKSWSDHKLAWEQFGYTATYWTDTLAYTKFFETTQSFGPNVTYTIKQDGVNRIKFPFSSFTESSTTTVSVIRTTTVFGSSLVWGSPEPSKPSLCENPKVRQSAVHQLQNNERRNACNMKDLYAFAARFGVEFVPTGTEWCFSSSTCSWAPMDEVVLIYWPSDTNISTNETIRSTSKHVEGQLLTITKDPSKPREYTTSAITFRGKDLYEVAMKYSNESTTRKVPYKYVSPYVMSGPWTFTSPTVYLAHRPISIFYSTGFQWESSVMMNNSMHKYSTFTTHFHRSYSQTGLNEGVLPLSSSQVFSVFHWVDGSPIRNGTEFVSQVVQGRFKPKFKAAEEDERQLDFHDLQDPVPASAYYLARWNDCWGEQSHCATITDDTFRPTLWILQRAWETIFPSPENCRQSYVVDPPIVLTKLDISSFKPAQNPDELSTHGSTDAIATTTFISGMSQPTAVRPPAPGDRWRPRLPAATPTSITSSDDAYVWNAIFYGLVKPGRPGKDDASGYEDGGSAGGKSGNKRPGGDDSSGHKASEGGKSENGRGRGGSEGNSPAWSDGDFGTENPSGPDDEAFNGNQAFGTTISSRKPSITSAGVYKGSADTVRKIALLTLIGPLISLILLCTI